MFGEGEDIPMFLSDDGGGGNGWRHPNNYLKTVNGIPTSGNTEKEMFLNKMAEEDLEMRNFMVKRKYEAAKKDNELNMIISALKSHGYNNDQINDIFNNGLLTPELIEELLK